MPSFDIVSEIDSHELTNAVDQTTREVNNRFDFKGSKSRIEQTENILNLIAPTEFQIKQMTDILHAKMAKRDIDVSCLEYDKIVESGNETHQQITARQGVDKELARKLIKIIKDAKLKVQTTVQGDQVRVSGKKRDDLQQVISTLREQNLGLPLQYINFRD